MTRCRRTGCQKLMPLLLLAVVVAFFAPVVFLGRAFFLKDAQLVVYPIRLALRRRLMAWDLPEWIPELDLGMPFLADSSNGVLYPLNVVLMLPEPHCVGLFIVAHSALAAVGAWYLLRALRLSISSSAAGALAFALGGYMVSLTWISNYMMSLAWLPWIAWGALQVLRKGEWRAVATTALLWAAQILSGEPQGVILTGWFVLALAVSRPLRRGQGLQRWFQLSCVVLLATALALPQILPSLELIPTSRRATGIDLEQAMHWSLHPLRLAELVVPWVFGNPLNFSEFVGFFMDDEGSAMHRDPWIATPYLGSLALVFICLALFNARRRHRYWVRASSVLCGLALLLALGRHTPVFAAYYEHVPGAQLFRYPAKFFGLCGALLPFVCAAGIDAWAFNKRRLRALSLGLGLIALLAAAWLLAPTIGSALHELRPSLPLAGVIATVQKAFQRELLPLLVLSGVLVAALHLNRQPLAGSALSSLAASALLVQLLNSNLRAYETAPVEIYTHPGPIATRILSARNGFEPVRLLHDAPTLSLSDLDASRAEVRGRALSTSLMKNVGIIHGISYAGAYMSSGEAAKHELWRYSDLWRRQLLDVFSVRYLAVPSALSLVGAPGLVHVTESEGSGVSVYENTTALPFAYAVSHALRAESMKSAIEHSKHAPVTEGRVALVEGIPYDVGPDAEPRRIGNCEPTQPISDTIDLRCQLEEPGWVVVNASHHANWRLTLDGEATELFRANGFVMAALAPAGIHRLHFEYAEPSLPFGALGSSLGLALCLLLVFRRRGLNPVRRVCRPL